MQRARTGTLVSIHGNVVDVHFEGGVSPLRQKLTVGGERPVAIEVAAHLDAHTIRGIALGPTRGLARGMPVTDTGRPLEVPVGAALLGRMLNAFGEPIDEGGALSDVQWRPCPWPGARCGPRSSRRGSR
jgi:F-type H+-transporting ATPase subunit beta